MNYRRRSLGFLTQHGKLETKIEHEFFDLVISDNRLLRPILDRSLECRYERFLLCTNVSKTGEK